MLFRSEGVYVIFPYDGSGYRTYDFSAWCLLTKRYRNKSNARGAASKGVYYIYQDQWPDEQKELRAILEKEPGMTREKIGSITLFHGERLIEGAGLVLQTDFD